METSPKFMERHEMSDAVIAPEFDERQRARNLIKQIAGHCWRGKGDMVDRVFDAITDAFPKSHWTRRRVRAFWHREQAGVRWREMQELEFVATIEKAKRDQEDASKAEHNEFIQHIASTLDRLAVADEAFHREHREALLQMAIGSIDPKVGNHARQGDQDAFGRREISAPNMSGGEW